MAPDQCSMAGLWEETGTEVLYCALCAAAPTFPEKGTGRS